MLLLLSALIPLTYAEWRAGHKHGSTVWCDVSNKEQWLTGACTSGRYKRCRFGGDSHAEAGRCQTPDEANFVESELEPRTWHSPQYVRTRDWGHAIQCRIDDNMAAVGLCSSGFRRDCKCGGTREQGCLDNRHQSHMLLCAEGLQLNKFDTYEESSYHAGGQLECKAGFVAYKLCASGEHHDCRDQEGNKVSTVLGCVAVTKIPGKEDPDKMISEIRGYWDFVVTSNNGIKGLAVTTSIVDTNSQTLDKSVTRSFGFSSKVAIRVGTLKNFVGVITTLGFDTNVAKTIRESTQTQLQKGETNSLTVSCNDSEGEFESLWQWVKETELENGKPGPLLKTSNYICTEGTQYTNIPLCHPRFCTDTTCMTCKEMETESESSREVMFVGANKHHLVVVAALALAVGIVGGAITIATKGKVIAGESDGLLVA